MLTSERYTAKESAKGGIESVKNNSPHEARFKRLNASNGQPYFNLIAANGEVIGTSEQYASATNRDNGINWVKTNGATAGTVDNT